MDTSPSLYVTTPGEWRAWLEQNHATQSSIWLIHYKKHTGKPSLAYDDALDEALCFGWIDSLIQRLDDERYAQKYTPRKNTSNWSAENKRRVRRLIDEGRMTPAGLAVVTFDLNEGSEVGYQDGKQKEVELPEGLRGELEAVPAAWEAFNRLAPTYRRQFIGYVTSAKRPETYQKRLQEVIQRLLAHKKMGEPLA